MLRRAQHSESTKALAAAGSAPRRIVLREQTFGSGALHCIRDARLPRQLSVAYPRPRADRLEGSIMDAVAIEKGQAEKRHLPAGRARIGMIIPSVNSMTEPQFNRFAPAGLGVHVARARVAGAWKRPLADMAEEIATSARLLADVAPDLIVFHCTDTSMTQGPQGEGHILDIVRQATGIEGVATSRLVVEALQALGLRNLVLL